MCQKLIWLLLDLCLSGVSHSYTIELLVLDPRLLDSLAGRPLLAPTSDSGVQPQLLVVADHLDLKKKKDNRYFMSVVCDVHVHEAIIESSAHFN